MEQFIELYRTRTTSEKMSDSFDFVRQNWRELLKWNVYLLLPVCLVFALTLDRFMGNYMGIFNHSNDVSGQTLSFIVPTMTAYIFMAFVLAYVETSLTFAMMRLYHLRRVRLSGLTFADLKPELFLAAKRILLLIPAMLLVGIVIVGVLAFVSALLGKVSPVLGILLYGVSLVVVIPLFTLTYPVYLYEDIPVFASFKKSFRLGWKTWGGIVGVMFMVSIICNIAQCVLMMPWYIILAVKTFFSTSGGFATSFGYTLIEYLMSVLGTFAICFTIMMMGITLSYLYGHAADKIDGVSVDRDIENF